LFSLLLAFFILALANVQLLLVEQGGTINIFSIYFAKTVGYCELQE
jgi:hypothetical protein